MRKLLTLISIAAACQSPLAQEQDVTLTSYGGQSSITALSSITLKPGFHIPSGSTVLLSIQGHPNISSAPSGNRNYILTRTFRTPVKADELAQVRRADQENRTVQYFDGLGRPLQTVEVMASPDHRDIVQHVEYDGFGRQTHQYLPYAEQTGNNGSFKANAKGQQAAFYGGSSWDPHVKKTPHPYAVTVFENSPLDRVQQQGAPGTAWQPVADRSAVTPTSPSGHTVATEYGTNVATGTEAVKLWEVTSNGAQSTANYAAGRLYRTVVKDENWTGGKTGTVEEYTDFEGHVVLRRIWESEGKKLETYYVYDDFGDLRYAIPPAVTAGSFTEQAAAFTHYIYGYRYDGRHRIIEKKVPGKGWEWIVYNRNDLPVLTQDAVQRNKTAKEWNYIKYDAFDRVTETGIFRSNLSRTSLQNTLNLEQVTSTTALWDTREYNGQAYDNKSYPRETSSKTVMTVNYYDDYGFKASNILAASQGLDSTAMVKGLLTGTRVGRDDGSNALLTVRYYDKRARLIQTAAQNQFNGGTDYVTNTYNFPGELLTSKREHRASSAGAVTTIVTRNEYDHVGRLTAVKHKVNAQDTVLLTRHEYNGIGQLMRKHLHSENGGTTFISSTDYQYNERGWMARIGSPNFTEVLYYNSPSLGTTTRQYNGNIAEQQWGHSTTTPNRFVYGYDRLDRLRNGTSTGTVMSEVLTYDDMGNIETLKRDNGTTISYAYSGNRLTTLSGGLTGSYTYDGNGNATKDRTNMTFTYNHLNLPRTAIRTGANAADVTYIYDAQGIKLRRTATVSGTTTQRDYIAGIEYNKVGSGASAIEMILTQEGYLQRNTSNNTYTYHYHLTDHLGNVRATLQRTTATTGTVIQKHDYYPFGKSKAIVTAGVNRYLYNGKEMQDALSGGTHALGSSYTLEGQLDYGARFYDAEIGRWNVVDPLAEMYHAHSPYNYALNDPVFFIDPNGMWVSTPGGYFSDDPNDFASFLHYLQNGQSDDWMADISTHIENSGNFYIGLSPITVTRRDFYNGSWVSAAQEQVAYHSRRLDQRSGGGSFFGDALTFTDRHFNGGLGTAGVAVQGYKKIPNDAKRRYAYKLSKATGVKSGQIFQRAKSFANSTGKLVSKLGPVGTLLSVGVAGYEVGTGTWDAHTVVNIGLMAGAGAATVFAAPAVLTGIAIYGVTDYFFDIGGAIDNAVGRNSGIW